jgi:hypothetical protein
MAIHDLDDLGVPSWLGKPPYDMIPYIPRPIWICFERAYPRFIPLINHDSHLMTIYWRYPNLRQKGIFLCVDQVLGHKSLPYYHVSMARKNKARSEFNLWGNDR